MAAQSYSQQNNELASRATEAFKKGDYTEAARHTLHYLLNGIPGLGARLDEAGNKGAKGDIGGMLADTAAIATDYVAGPKVGGKLLNAATEPDAAARAVQPIKDTLAKHPGLVKHAGTAAGALVGHETGIGPYVGWYIGREAAKSLNEWLTKGKPVAEAPPILDEIAQGMAGKKFSALDAAAQQTVRDAAAQLAAKETGAPGAASATPAPTPQPVNRIDLGPPQAAGHTIQEQLTQYLESQRPKTAPITDPNARLTPEASAALDAKLQNLLVENRIKAGDDPNLHLGEVKGGKYLNRFGGSDSPVIDSGKRRPDSSAKVANPSKLRIISPSPSQLRMSAEYKKLLKNNPAAARAAMDLATELER